MKIILAIVIAGFTLVAWSQQPPSSPQEFLLGRGDLISVEVFDVPELKQEIRISDAGDANFAIVGRLHLAGLTVDGAEGLLAANLRDQRLVPDPQVTLFIREYATQGVSITGEVRKPGVYRVLGPHTLMQMITEAGGLTEVASAKISIRHQNGDHETVTLQANASSGDAAMSPGDLVFVPRAGIVYIVGDVARSGGYVMQNAGELTVAQLVAMGGGTLPTAKSANAKLVRLADNSRVEIAVNLKQILRGRSPDIPLHPNDILFVPNSLLKSAANRLQNITQMAAGAAIYTSLN